MYWMLPLLIAAALMGFLGTWAVSRYALRQSLIDVPNDRSSHTVPTPRGGGLSITLVILVAIPLLPGRGVTDGGYFLALFPSVLLVSAIGWIEDHVDLPAVVRGVGYLLAALWFVFFLGGLDGIALGTMQLVSSNGLGFGLLLGSQGVTGLQVPAIGIGALLVVGIAWLTNLFNFMDGTDGLAAMQAILAGTASGYLLWLDGGDQLALMAWLSAAASAGFLVWNWAPASIFMGDVGSCVLGFVFGCLAVLGEKLVGLPMLLWLILLAFFVWDATFTLCWRVLRGERWYSAHRAHAYQRLVQLGLSHAQLAWLFSGVNVVVLWPLAWWGYRQPEQLLAAFVSSVFLMGLIWSAVQVYYYRQS